MVKDESTRECKGGKMRYDAEYVVPIVTFIILILVFGLLWLVISSSEDNGIKLCNENSLEYLGRIKDANGYYDDYCGELKNGMLVKKYKIINNKYLEDES